MGNEDESCEALLEEQHTFSHPRRSRSGYDLIIPWALAIFFFCTTCFFALPINHHASRKSNSFENGFETDFVSSSLSIPINIIRKRFTNDLLFNATSQALYNEPLDENETTYIGEPSPAIDAAWHDLLHAQYMALEAEEVEQIPAAHRENIWYDGEHNFMELSVFHNLHCLNELRLALDDDDDDEDDDAGSGAGDKNWMHQGRAHLDHCVDQIRQALMCHADLTPVPMMPVEGGPEGLIIGNGEVHTCRDFDAIWAWVEERGRKHKAMGD